MIATITMAESLEHHHRGGRTVCLSGEGTPQWSTRASHVWAVSLEMSQCLSPQLSLSNFGQTLVFHTLAQVLGA